MLAEDIVSVQPMGASKLEIGETYVDESNTVECYWVRLPTNIGSIFNMSAHGKYIDEVEAWCEETFGPRCSETNWYKINARYCFKRAEDRMAFVLKWA
jgi:hypothetical protein